MHDIRFTAHGSYMLLPHTSAYSPSFTQDVSQGCWVIGPGSQLVTRQLWHDIIQDVMPKLLCEHCGQNSVHTSWILSNQTGPHFVPMWNCHVDPGKRSPNCCHNVLEQSSKICLYTTSSSPVTENEGFSFSSPFWLVVFSLLVKHFRC